MVTEQPGEPSAHLTTSAPHAMSLALRGHYALATWFGCGFSKVAPGTAGSLGAIPLLWGLSHAQSIGLNLGLIALLSGLGAWSAHVVARHRGDDDPGLVVIDEVAGVLIAFTWVQAAGYRYQIAAWVLFRILDITKPGPIGTLEHTKPIGVGIMLDDLLAGFVAGALAYSATLLFS